MTNDRIPSDKLLTRWLCGLVLLNACLGWYCWHLAAFAKLLYRQILPGAAVDSICQVALRAPDGLFVMTGVTAVALTLAAFGKVRGQRLLWLVLAFMLADIIALSLMAGGLMSPFSHVTWGVSK